MHFLFQAEETRFFGELGIDWMAMNVHLSISGFPHACVGKAIKGACNSSQEVVREQ
jgi:hypothetical protein